MSDIEYHKSLFKESFYKLVRQQNEIINGLIGQCIKDIFYETVADGYNVDIKDPTVVHIPLGFLSFTTTSDERYIIDTNYQAFCGGIFGLKVGRGDYPLDRIPANHSSDNNWTAIKVLPITKIEWNWTREINCPLSGQILSIDEASQYLSEDSFVPDNLVFHFGDKRTFIFSREPDEEILHKKTYTLLTGGEELMIFFEEERLVDWDIKARGFQIALH